MEAAGASSGRCPVRERRWPPWWTSVASGSPATADATRHGALIGGQLVRPHCAERGGSPTRPTNDADTVVDVRASPTVLAT